MSRISIEEVKHVAHLARLAITEEEAKMFTEQARQYHFICRGALMRLTQTMWSLQLTC